MARKDPIRAAQILERGFPHLKLGARLREYRIKKAWAGVVGETVALRARPVKLMGSTLHVEVSSSVWMNELSFQKKLIIEGINKALGESGVKSIVLRAGALPDAATKDTTPDESKDQPQPVRALTKEERAVIDEAVKDVEDPELKGLLKRIMALEKRAEE